MKISNAQCEILHILFDSKTSLSLNQISEQTKYKFLRATIVSHIIENLIGKNPVFHTGIYRDYSSSNTLSTIPYSIK